MAGMHGFQGQPSTEAQFPPTSHQHPFQAAQMPFQHQEAAAHSGGFSASRLDAVKSMSPFGGHAQQAGPLPQPAHQLAFCAFCCGTEL